MKNQKLVMGFRQYYQGKGNKVEYHYCILHISPKMKKLLLSKNEEAISKVTMLLFKKELLLVGHGLCHEIKFFEEGVITEKIICELTI